MDKIDAKEFIKIWQNAKNVDEVSTATGLSKALACARASRYRKKDIPLKKFRPSVKWDELAEYAKEIRNENQNDR